jgi:hypothetical protein
MDIIYRYDPFAALIPRQSMDAQLAIRELEEGHQTQMATMDDPATTTRGRMAAQRPRFEGRRNPAHRLMGPVSSEFVLL